MVECDPPGHPPGGTAPLNPPSGEDWLEPPPFMKGFAACGAPLEGLRARAVVSSKPAMYGGWMMPACCW